MPNARSPARSGDEVLTAFYVFDADAGHDYGTYNAFPFSIRSTRQSPSRLSSIIYPSPFNVFDADAGHDYGTIETKGYRHIVCEINGEVTVLDNPRW